MSAEAKKIVRNCRIRFVLYLIYSFGVLGLFLNNPADVYTYDWPWFEYNIYTTMSFVVFITLELTGFVVYHYFEEKFSRIVNEQCDPFLYAECLERMKLTQVSKNAYYYNLSAAYANQGDYDKAWKLLMKVNPTRMKGIFRNNYYLLKCQLLYEYKMIDQMKQVEDEFRLYIRNKKDEVSFRTLCTQNNLYRAYLNKDYEAAYRFNAEYFEQIGLIKYRIQKVHFVYSTGLLDKEMGNNVSAKAAFRFVIENGNKLNCVEQAKQMLAEMEEPKEGGEE